MKLLALVVLLAAAPLPPDSRPTFEGRIEIRLQDDGPGTARYSVRRDLLRIDIPSVGGKHDLHAVMNLTRGSLMTSIAGGPWTPAAVFPEVIAPERIEVRKTGRARAVAGQPCEEWTMTDGVETVEACVVPGAAWLDPRRLTSGGIVPNWSRLLEARHAFPVSVWEGGARTRFGMWATDVKHEPVADDVVSVPRTARVH
jgi:hypothetical protein